MMKLNPTELKARLCRYCRKGIEIYLRNPKMIMRNPRMVKPIVNPVPIRWIDLRNSLSSLSRCTMWLNWDLRIKGIACSSESVPLEAISSSASLIFLSRNCISIWCVVSSKIFIIALHDKNIIVTVICQDVCADFVRFGQKPGLMAHWDLLHAKNQRFGMDFQYRAMNFNRGLLKQVLELFHCQVSEFNLSL